MAQKILAGEDPSRLPVVTQSTASPMFDYLQLTRFKLPLAALPAGSIIINQPVSFYARYKSLTLAVSWIIAFLILTVAILTMTIIRLLRTQARLRESEEKYRFLVRRSPRWCLRAMVIGASISSTEKLKLSPDIPRRSLIPENSNGQT